MSSLDQCKPLVTVLSCALPDLPTHSRWLKLCLKMCTPSVVAHAIRSQHGSGAGPPCCRRADLREDLRTDRRRPCATGFAEQVLGETKTPSRDRTLQGTAEHILDVLVPDMVEQLVKLPKTVSENRIQELTVEHIVVDIPVQQVAEELVEVSKVFPMDRIQQRFVEQTNETLDVSLAEKVCERPVTQTQQVVNTSVQHVFNTVEAEKHINQVTRHIEIPMLQIIKKTVEVPEVPPLQFTDKVADNPVVAQRQISMVLTVPKRIEIPTVATL